MSVYVYPELGTNGGDRDIQSRPEKDMTICIAALADSGKSVVMVRDTKTSFPSLGWSYESDEVNKLVEPITGVAIMYAGDAECSREIIRSTTFVTALQGEVVIE